MVNYVIFDIEATCWDDAKEKNKNFMEIIEIGAVRLNCEFKVVDIFSHIIKPVYNPKLSDFCKNLTKIEQSDIDNGESFNEVMDKFNAFVENKDILLSWGFLDKTIIQKESKLKKYSGEILDKLQRHISLKHEFAQYYGIKPCGMAKVIEMLGINADGKQHRALDDAKNASKIFEKVHDSLCFEQYFI